MAGEFGKQLRKIEARFAAKGDQELQEFKAIYFDWTPEVKVAFRNAIGKAVEASSILHELPSSCLTIKVASSLIIHDDEGNIVYDGCATMPPQTLLKAIDAWDAGEEFSPGGMAFIG